MKESEIVAIEAIPIRVELPRRYSGSYYAMRNRCTVVTRVRTAGGVVGEIYTADTDREQIDVVAMIQNEIAPALLGASVLANERCWELALPTTFDQLRDRRISMQAIAAVDAAIWDAKGRLCGRPLYEMWGGFQNSVPVIGIGGYYSNGDPDERSIEEQVGWFVEAGVCGMKFKIGGAAPSVDAERLRRAVDSGPADFNWVVDANQGYRLEEAQEFVRLIEGLVTLSWFEEPCRWYNDERWMRDLRSTTGVRVAAGQSEFTSLGVRNLIQSGAIDVCNFDASWGGGPTEWLRVASMASLYGVEMGHHEEAHIAAHLLAAVRFGTFAEVFDSDRDPVFWNLLENRPELENGRMRLPDGPGFGWSLDQDFIARYRNDR